MDGLILAPTSHHQIMSSRQLGEKIKNLKSLAKTTQFDIQSIKSIKDEDKKLKLVSAELESILVKMMFNSMKNTLSSENSLLNGGYAEKVFDDILLTERSRIVAHKQSLGLAKIIYQQHAKYL